jgi:hypothetical protein
MILSRKANVPTYKSARSALPAFHIARLKMKNPYSEYKKVRTKNDK